MTTIVNSSLASGVFPKALIEGIIRPSFKKQSLDPEVLSNYRPVTNIPYVSKILERVVASQLMSYLLGNDLLAKFQSAYRNFYSTETCLVRVTNDILRAIDRRQEVVLVLLDLSSAFDTIDHTILIERLQNRYGLNGSVLDWFKSFIVNRLQSVAIKGTRSSKITVNYGVQQGSVLGPMLFSLFIAPIEDILLAHNSSFMIYADDTQLYVSFDNQNRNMQLSNLESNGLVCNADKTEVIHLSSRFANDIESISGINI